MWNRPNDRSEPRRDKVNQSGQLPIDESHSQFRKKSVHPSNQNARDDSKEMSDPRPGATENGTWENSNNERPQNTGPRNERGMNGIYEEYSNRNDRGTQGIGGTNNGKTKLTKDRQNGRGRNRPDEGRSTVVDYASNNSFRKRWLNPKGMMHPRKAQVLRYVLSCSFARRCGAPMRTDT